MSSPFLEPGQLGSRRFAVRPIPGPRFLGGVLLSATVTVVICLFVPSGGLYVAVGGAVGLLIVHGGVIGSGLIEQHRVHDRGLLLGPTVAGTTPFVIPWSTVDPLSLQVHRRANLVGGRYGPNGLSSNLRMAGPARHHVDGPLGRGAAARGADRTLADGGARPRAAGPGGRVGAGRRRAPRRAGRPPTARSPTPCASSARVRGPDTRVG